jgi:protein TonB
MRSFRIVPRVFAAALILGSAALLAQESPQPRPAAPEPASFDRLNDLLSRDQVAGAVAELAAIATQSWPAQPTLGSFEETTLRRAIQAGRSHLGKVAASAADRRASRWLVCLARAYFPDEELPSLPPPVQGLVEPLRVMGEVSRPEIIGQVKPQYTAEAKEKRVSGTAILESVIDREGCIRSTRVLKGLPYGLDEVAMAAIRNWAFEPARLNGEPVKVYYVLTVNYQIEKREKGAAEEPSPGQKL